jgi:cbb3-type cytochrome oxidase subunit 3
MSAAQLLQVAVLLALLAAFLGLLFRLSRPGVREEARRAAEIPFHEDRKDAA